jgi:hypothetical protein
MDGDGSSLGQVQTTLRKYNITSENLGSCSEVDVSNWIREGKAVVVLTNSYTGSGNGYIGHKLVAVGIDKAGTIYTKDPYYNNSTPFTRVG